jgi:hypothetical protein
MYPPDMTHDVSEIDIGYVDIIDTGTMFEFFVTWVVAESVTLTQYAVDICDDNGVVVAESDVPETWSVWNGAPEHEPVLYHLTV